MSDLDDHLDGRKGGGDVLRVRWSHRDGNAARVQAPVERRDQVDTCSTGVHVSTSKFKRHRHTQACVLTLNLVGKPEPRGLLPAVLLAPSTEPPLAQPSYEAAGR